MKLFKDNNGNVYAYEADGSQDSIIKPGLIRITDKEADELRAKVNNNLDYKQKRLSEYPSIGDQLDALYKAGVFPADLTAKIKAVKDKYPKQ